MNNGLMIALAGFVGFIIGYVVCGVMDEDQLATNTSNTTQEEQANTAGTNAMQSNSTDTTNPASNDTETESELVSGDPDDVAFSIAVASLPSAQQQALRLAGVDEDEIVITNSMVVCAEAELGSERVVEIQGGDTPSMTEGVTLVSCYSSN